MSVNFKVSPEDAAKIDQAVKRAKKLCKEHGVKFDSLTLSMDLTAVHVNGCPLDLDKLLAFDDVNFAHDIFGIQRHIDRNTGALQFCFLPRCSR